MSWWDDSLERVIRLRESHYGLEIPFDACVDVCGSLVRYEDLRLVLRRAPSKDCCAAPCSCHDDVCCGCEEEVKVSDDLPVVACYEAMGLTSAGAVRFRLDDELMKRGHGRYEGMLERRVLPDDKCKEWSEVCPFVLIIEEPFCLDWKRAKGVRFKPELMGDKNGKL